MKILVTFIYGVGEVMGKGLVWAGLFDSLQTGYRTSSGGKLLADSKNVHVS
jgi:hypothetical protein